MSSLAGRYSLGSVTQGDLAFTPSSTSAMQSGSFAAVGPSVWNRLSCNLRLQIFLFYDSIPQSVEDHSVRSLSSLIRSGAPPMSFLNGRYMNKHLQFQSRAVGLYNKAIDVGLYYFPRRPFPCLL